MKTTSPFALVLLSVAMFTTACEEPSNNHNDERDGGQHLADLGDHADLTSGQNHWGFVTAYSQAYKGGSMQTFTASSLQAGFVRNAGPSSCVDTPIGDCETHTSCSNDASPTDWVGAGTVTLQGAARPASITQGTTTYQPFWDMDTSFYAGGETLSFGATGGVAPAISTTLTAPSVVVVTSPLLPQSGERVAVSRGQDFVVKWSAQGVGDVLVWVGPQSGYVTITCRFDRSKGSGVVPKAAMAKLQAGEGSISVRAEAATTIRDGAWSIDVTASNSGTDAAGYNFSLATTYE